MAFAVQGPEAFEQSGRYGSDVDCDAADAEAGTTTKTRRAVSGRTPGQPLRGGHSLPALRARVAEVTEKTERVLRGADLDSDQPLPEAPWLEAGARWSVRRVAAHIPAEISQHARQADTIRKAIDGHRSMG